MSTVFYPKLNILKLSVLIKREKHAIPIEKYASLLNFFYKIKNALVET